MHASLLEIEECKIAEILWNAVFMCIESRS